MDESEYARDMAVIAKAVLLALLIVGLGACAPAATRSGLSLPEAKALEHRLAVGMGADEVTALLGDRQRTRTEDCGADRPAGACVEWVYVFPATTTCGVTLGQFSCFRTATNYLILRFDRAGDGWSLERWNWRLLRED